MSLEVKVNERSKSIFKVAIQGSIDSENCPKLEAEMDSLLAQSPEVVIIDLEGVTYITSMGLSLMVKTEKNIKDKGKTLLVINIPPQIQKVFDVIAALPSMRIFKNIEEADAYLI